MAEKDEFEHQKTELEAVCSPIMSKVHAHAHQQSGGGGGGEGEGPGTPPGGTSGPTVEEVN
jgi:heat shock 70kDa protein 1/2/6/8